MPFNFQTNKTYMMSVSRVNNQESRIMLNEFQKTIGYQFNNNQLLLDCLTKSKDPYGNLLAYQRLEHLGDKVMNLVITDIMFDDLPDSPANWQQ